MTISLREPGSTISVPRSVSATKPAGAFTTIARALGFGQRAAHHAADTDEVVCPYRFAIVNGSEAEEAMAALQAQDVTPVILGTPSAALDLISMYAKASPDDFTRQVAALNSLDLDAWIAGQNNSEGEDALPHGPWPTEDLGEADSKLYCVRKPLQQEQYEEEVVVAAIPTADPTVLPLHLGYGNWNSCPSPAVHAAFARRWYANYRATPIAFAGDVVEYRVNMPVATREQALAVAQEHFAYCQDAVLQGGITLEDLAAGLIGARYWLFWWD